ncbi:MAG TPA: C4-type zinc ribbon domain-containing protein [Candidatus Eisenbacteria bacterium]|nr:C4-type zinc ribbon domain-containing protein [Candidatus Eisenbacteria bacterium]
MLPEMEALLALQRQDSMILESRRRRDDIPRRRESLREAVNRAKAALEDTKKDLEQARLQRRSVEKDVEGITADSNKLERQLHDVKTNKEYQAILHEIELLKNKRSDYETRILESYDREEALVAAQRAAERAVQSEETKLKEGEQTLAKEAADLDQSLHSMEQDRNAVKPRVPGPLLSRYDRLLGARDGVAVAEIKKGACGACFKGLTPHALQEARRGEAIQTCEACGRILILVEVGAA